MLDLGRTAHASVGSALERQRRVWHTQVANVGAGQLTVLVEVIKAQIQGKWPQFDLVGNELILEPPPKHFVAPPQDIIWTYNTVFHHQ